VVPLPAAEARDMLASVDLAAIAVGALVGCVGIYLTYLTWRDRRGRAQLQYVVTTKSRLVPQGWAESLQVVHDGGAVEDPGLVITRIVHAGDRAIEADDFETDLTMKLTGAGQIASVNQTGQRPADLAPELAVDGDTVRLRPTLINPGDMIELQVLCSGLPERIELGGRASEVTFKQLPRLPYPPGGGPEGELLPFDKFMVWVLPVGLALGTALAFALNEASSTATRIAVPAGALLVGLVIYPWRQHWLIKRRAMWKPGRLPDPE
jgi:hypothetical protein